MYNIVIWHLYNLWYDHYDKSSNHLSTYRIITIWLTVFPMLYTTSLWLIYSITGSLYLLFPFTFFTNLPTEVEMTSGKCWTHSRDSLITLVLVDDIQRISLEVTTQNWNINQGDILHTFDVFTFSRISPTSYLKWLIHIFKMSCASLKPLANICWGG